MNSYFSDIIIIFATAPVAMRAAPRSFHWVGLARPPLSFPSETRTRKEWKSPGLTLVYKWTAYSVQNTITQSISVDLPRTHVRSVISLSLLYPLYRCKHWGSVKFKALLDIGVSEWQTNLWHWSTTISILWQAAPLTFIQLNIQSLQEVTEFLLKHSIPGSLLGFLNNLVLSQFFKNSWIFFSL